VVSIGHSLVGSAATTAGSRRSEVLVLALHRALARYRPTVAALALVAMALALEAGRRWC